MKNVCGNEIVAAMTDGIEDGIHGDQTTIMDVHPRLSVRDILGGWRARWGVLRMNYKVLPGLYRSGTPDTNSPVLVTSNYKLTFDAVRKELSGLHVWLLVLDTNGVNVWCAAGKGTFGTDELIRKIKSVNLSRVVNHSTVILPQLGAPGVASPAVKKATGFRVVYGPVYAEDIAGFLTNGMSASDEMRRVRFGLRDRLKVVPVEIVYSWWLLPVTFIALVVFRLLDGKGISRQLLADFIPYVGAYVMGTVLFPILMPWLPGRSFALKGWLLGLVWAIAVNFSGTFTLWQQCSQLLLVPVIVSFWALNFTGSTTFTSRSGVLKEMRVAMPLIIVGIVIGIAVRIVPAVIN